MRDVTPLPRAKAYKAKQRDDIPSESQVCWLSVSPDRLPGHSSQRRWLLVSKRRIDGSVTIAAVLCSARAATSAICESLRWRHGALVPFKVRRAGTGQASVQQWEFDPTVHQQVQKSSARGEVRIVRRCMARFWPEHELAHQPDKGPRYERSVLCSSVCLFVLQLDLRSRLQTALGLIYLDGGEDWTVEPGIRCRRSAFPKTVMFKLSSDGAFAHSPTRQFKRSRLSSACIANALRPAT